MSDAVVILRPQPGADATAARARAAGLAPVLYPLFAVEPLAWMPPDPAGFDALMLTSANAVRHAGPMLSAYLSLPVFAIGKTSARAATDQGFTIVHAAGPDAQATARAIAQAGHRNVLHLRGDDARPFDPGSLSVTAIATYRSAPCGDEAGLMAALRLGSVALVHSPRAGERLSRLTGPARRQDISVVAISNAALAACGPGWKQAHAAQAPDDADMLAMTLQICDKAS